MDNNRIHLHDKVFKPFIPYSEISSAIDSVADRINADFRDAQDIPILLCVLNGSIMFTSELMKRLEFNLEVVSIKLSSYSGTSSGKIREVMGLTGGVRGRRVIVVEDIVDTGNTIVNLKQILEDAGAGDIRFCTMLLKPDVYDKPVRLDYVGKEIPNAFIVGFGLDYDQLGRNYKDIYVIDNQ